MNNPRIPLPSLANLGSRINLNNAKAKLTERRRVAKNSANYYYKEGMAPLFREMNSEVNRTNAMLEEVNRRIKIRHENLSKRHFSRANLNKILSARQQYQTANKFHLYIRAVDNLMKKYRIPQSNMYKGGHWNLVNKMINENKLSRNQLSHMYGLHWQIQAAKKRRART